MQTSYVKIPLGAACTFAFARNDSAADSLLRPARFTSSPYVADLHVPDGSHLHDKDCLSRTIQTWAAKKRGVGKLSFLEDHFPLSNTFQMPSCAGDPDFADALGDELRDTVDSAPDTCELSMALHKNQHL